MKKKTDNKPYKCTHTHTGNVFKHVVNGKQLTAFNEQKNTNKQQTEMEMEKLKLQSAHFLFYCIAE